MKIVRTFFLFVLALYARCAISRRIGPAPSGGSASRRSTDTKGH